MYIMANEEIVKDKKQYEIAVLLTAEDSVNAVTRLFGQHQIEVREAGQLKKVALSYPVKKATQAFFGYFYVSAAPSSATSLEKDFRNQAGVLRSLILNIPKQKPDMGDGRDRKPFMRRPAPSSSAAPEMKPRKPLSNEAIEKKIEEILQ